MADGLAGYALRARQRRQGKLLRTNHPLRVLRLPRSLLQGFCHCLQSVNGTIKALSGRRNWKRLQRASVQNGEVLWNIYRCCSLGAMDKTSISVLRDASCGASFPPCSWHICMDWPIHLHLAVALAERCKYLACYAKGQTGREVHGTNTRSLITRNATYSSNPARLFERIGR